MANTLLLNDFDDSKGIEVNYDKATAELVMHAWFNYSDTTEEIRVNIEEFLKMFEIPISIIKKVYGEDAFLVLKKQGRPKKEVRDTFVKKHRFKWVKEEDLFKWNRNKPKIDLVCQYSECKKTFTVTINEKNRVYCCQKCSNLAFKQGIDSGENNEKARIAIKRRKEINDKIKETKRKNKEKKLQEQKKDE